MDGSSNNNRSFSDWRTLKFASEQQSDSQGRYPGLGIALFGFSEKPSRARVTNWLPQGVAPPENGWVSVRRYFTWDRPTRADRLQNITARLLGDKLLKVQNPALYIVQKLMKEKTSPLYGWVHEGGKVQKGATLSGLTIANLRSAISDKLTRSAKLAQFPDADAQHQVIKHYWIALKKWLPKAWNSPREYAIFKGVGLYAISYVGIEVIDRSLLKGRFSSDDMLAYLKQMPSEPLAKKAKRLPTRAAAADEKLRMILLQIWKKKERLAYQNSKS